MRHANMLAAGGPVRHGHAQNLPAPTVAMAELDAGLVDDLIFDRAAEANWSGPSLARDLASVHLRGPEGRHVVGAVVEVPHPLLRDIHALGGLQPSADALDGKLLRAVNAADHEGRVDLDALAAPPALLVQRRPGPVRRHELAGHPQPVDEHLPFVAVPAAGVPGGDDADVAAGAEGAGEALADDGEREIAAAVGGVYDWQLLVSWAVFEVALLASQRPVDVEGAEARLQAIQDLLVPVATREGLPSRGAREGLVPGLGCAWAALVAATLLAGCARARHVVTERASVPCGGRRGGGGGDDGARAFLQEVQGGVGFGEALLGVALLARLPGHDDGDGRGQERTPEGSASHASFWRAFGQGGP
mmetsp:Transcript_112147/g.219877  ORF Transcript_112147/g.219877 Transcript_112147/m.219877 type:complete len:361 (-) Transcript_112147:50-1132(-)